MGIAMVVAVFVMTMAIAQGFNGALVASGSQRERDPAAQGRDLGDGQRRAAIAAAADRGDAAGRRAPATATPLASPELVVIIALPRPSDNQPANVPVRGVGPLAFEVRNTLTFVEGRRFTPGTREINVGKQAIGPVQGADARQRREVRRRDLEGRRRLHRRRCVVRVGGVGRRRPDDAGVPAQRLPVGDAQADRSVGVRVVRGGGRRPTRGSISSRIPSATTTQGSRDDDRHADPRVRHVRHARSCRSARCSAR